MWDPFGYNSSGTNKWMLALAASHEVRLIPPFADADEPNGVRLRVVGHRSGARLRALWPRAPLL
jgi:hypothetical protein